MVAAVEHNDYSNQYEAIEVAFVDHIAAELAVLLARLEFAVVNIHYSIRCVALERTVVFAAAQFESKVFLIVLGHR